MKTIRSVAEGAHVLPPQMTGTLFSQIARDAIVKGRPEALDAVRMTPREREVINHIAEGLSNKEIGGQLNVATHTVKSHVHNIMEKTDAAHAAADRCLRPPRRASPLIGPHKGLSLVFHPLVR